MVGVESYIIGEVILADRKDPGVGRNPVGIYLEGHLPEKSKVTSFQDQIFDA